ncbi:MAG: TolC family protein, partial [Planctomycetota bacterium]|nr:TolC family protein [Planctomycetota bacterium]
SNQLMRNLEFNNPQMRGWDCLEQAHQMKVHLAELGMFPNFTIGIDWTGIESNGIGNDSGKDAFALGVGLELPLQHRSRKSRVRQSRSMLASIRAQRIQTLSTLLSELETEFFKLRDAERRFELHQNGLVPKGQQALDSTLIAYQSGKASFLDYLDTQRTLLDSELAVLRATADRSITLAEIAALSGTQLSER